MKKIKCIREISSIRVGEEIIRFQGFHIQDKTITVSDKIAKILLKKEGFELVEDLGKDPAPKQVDVNKYNNLQKKEKFLDRLIYLFTGGK